MKSEFEPMNGYFFGGVLIVCGVLIITAVVAFGKNTSPNPHRQALRDMEFFIQTNMANGWSYNELMNEVERTKQAYAHDPQSPAYREQCIRVMGRAFMAAVLWRPKNDPTNK